MSSLSSIVIPAVRKHTATVIFAHGLGDSGAGWVWLAENWRRSQRFEEVKFIFPNAPTIPITVNMRLPMPGWYDITQLTDLQDSEISHDEPGILQSRATFHQLIDSEVNAGIAPNRIVLAGFSQGGAMSVFAGLTSAHKLGGIVGLSCYLLLHQKFREYLTAAGNINQTTKIFLGHGDADPLVKPEWGQRSALLLKDLGFDVDFRLYPDLVHSAHPTEIRDMEDFLSERVPPLNLDLESLGRIVDLMVRHYFNAAKSNEQRIKDGSVMADKLQWER